MPAPLRPRRSLETPPPLGVTMSVLGTEVAVVARHATAVDLCLFTEGSEKRLPLRRTAHGIWWDLVPDGALVPGTRYGFRVDGPWDPHVGHRHNAAKLLLDPYGQAVDGWVHWEPEVYGHVVDGRDQHDHDTRDDRDSAPFVPRSVVVDQAFDWGDDVAPAVPWSETVVYEAHVRGLTMRHPAVPPHLQGTYAALAHPAVLEHLTGLGVTTLELLPVHAFASEAALVQRGLRNYWGYNSLGFFAPHAGYAAANDPQGVVDELKGAVRALHAAGIEVLLDVVYNHTAEQSSHNGPTLSWRGLDNRTYYRLDDRGRDIDVTGTGNTVDLRDPLVVRMVLDSLRHWVQEFHVDGFRFDLAPALARGDDGYRPDHPFLVALQTDPVLSGAKLVAEPWDVGVHGWRTGQFPPPFAEWNDRYRDTVRTFWLADTGRSLAGQPGHGVRELATRIAGSADMFAAADRGPVASVNIVTAHDGFTMADLTAYETKHNLANGEDNRDGHSDNRSWNHGVEGPTTDVAVLEARQRSVRNLLATLLLSTGVPMLVAGDELGRTQGGNNNAYNQDNSTSWLRWTLEPWQEALLGDTRALLALRRELPVLRPATFPTYEPVAGRSRLRWYDESGHSVSDEAWADPSRRTVVALYDSLHEVDDRQAVVLVVHGGLDAAEVVAPEVHGVATWRVRWSSTGAAGGAPASGAVAPGEPLQVGATSFTVLVGALEG
ncbi:glycogen debranching protein GlgX [Ornithinimicrobium pekingense]|uniref:Glycogen operon protein GlgX homolog n=1 Tax=Ornithinimicrobium pekingense TaxID=384677 RepID=A0ABQ2F6T8_9MICO|nr:glycogen debranching protein GlgX [Ornithinimicrobium pekingense]GGK59557.1 glycogen operon protein GlgX homolog [Ornithinimicrobium pekingense]